MSDAPQAKTDVNIHTYGVTPKTEIVNCLHHTDPFISAGIAWSRQQITVIIPVGTLAAHAAAFRELADKLDALDPTNEEEQA